MKNKAVFVNQLICLANGHTLADSQLRSKYFQNLKKERILVPDVHGSKVLWKADSAQSLRKYVAEEFNINDLEKYKEMLESENISRSTMVEVTGDSKFLKKRSFMGFLINTYQPIEALVNGKSFTVFPADGTFTFIYDYRNFIISPEVIVVGIENSENFRYVSAQRMFFEKNISCKNPLLFVSRYPQNGDLTRWLKLIPNEYVHFGDLDLAGINIYQTEFFQYLTMKSHFLIPEDYEMRIMKGSTSRYINQYEKFKNMKITDERVLPLFDCINKYRRGYDQEGYINF